MMEKEEKLKLIEEISKLKASVAKYKELSELITSDNYRQNTLILSILKIPEIAITLDKEVLIKIFNEYIFSKEKSLDEKLEELEGLLEKVGD